MFPYSCRSGPWPRFLSPRWALRSRLRVHLQFVFDPRRHAVNRRRQRIRLRTPSLRHVRATATLAANLLGNKVDQFTRLDLRRQIRRHARDQADLVAARTTEQNDAGAELVLELIHQRAQIIAAHIIKLGRQQFHALDVLRLRSEIAAGARRQLALRSEEHTSELQSLMRISYAVFCLKKKKQ